MSSPHRLVVSLIYVALSGWSPVPASMCEMPRNEHFWQGVKVLWRGQIVDIMSSPHGGMIVFTDARCGASVKVDPKIVPHLFSRKTYPPHAAVAQFTVRGRIAYKDGGVVLQPTTLKRRSPWMTDDTRVFHAYMEQRRSAQIATSR